MISLLLTGLLASLATASGDPRQINPVSVLLPYTDPALSDHRVNVTLQAFGGCYKWKVQRPNVVRIRDPKPQEIHELLGITQDDDEQVGHQHIGVSTQTAYQPPAASVGGHTFFDNEDSFDQHEREIECHNAVVVSQWIDANDALSASAVTSSSPPSRTDKSWVFAEDQGEDGVKCEVHVAPIKRIVIETTAKSLTVGGVETLRIKGLDEHDNVFTSLEGLRFEWELEDPKVLSIASLQNDVYRPSHVRRAIHDKGEQSDIILLKGLKSGRTIVKARLLEPGYERISAAEVWLDVIEPLVTSPSSLVVPPLAEFDIGLKVLRDKETPRQAPLVSLPNKDFGFAAVESPFLDVHPRTGRVIVQSERAVAAPQTVAVSDIRNSNNTDSTMILLREPELLKLVQGPLGPITNVDEGLLQPGQEQSLATMLEAFADEQLTPKSVPHMLSQSMRSLGGAPRPIWYLPRGRPAIFSAEMFSRDGEQIYIPHNAKFEMNTLNEEATGPAKLQLLWQSQHQALAVAKPVENEFGLIRATFQHVRSGDKSYSPAQSLTVTQKYVVVEPVHVTGLPEMRTVRGSLPASPVPIVLPPNKTALFSVTGGSGNYKFISSDNGLCSLKKNSGAEFVISTGDGTGMTTLMVSDEQNPSNYYRIHCVVAPIGSIAYDPASNQIPLRPGERTLVPIEAVAAVPETVVAPKVWIPIDPRRRTKDDLNVFPSHRHLYAFTMCQDIKAPQGEDVTADIRHTASSGQVQLRPVRSHELYSCGAVEVTHPDKPLSVQLFGQLSDSIRTSTELEFFSDLRTYLPQQEALDRLNLEIHTASLKSQEDFQLSSPRMADSIAAAIGAPVEVQLVGGPSFRLGCDRSVTATARQPSTVSIVQTKSNAPPHPQAIKDGAFQITCLDVATLVEIDFVIQSSCAESPLKTTLLMGCSVPHIAKILPDDSAQAYRVESMAPTQAASNWKVAQSVGDTLPTNINDAQKDSRVYITCGDKHKFEMVAWDAYKRPLVALGPFKASWGMLTPDGDRNDARVSFDSHPHCVKVAVGDQYCQGEMELAAVLKYHPDVPSVLAQKGTRGDVALLKQTLATTSALLNSQHWQKTDPNRPLMMSIIETPITAQPRLTPTSIKDESLILRNDWAYRIMTQFGSPRSRFRILPKTGGRSAATLPQLVSIDHYNDLTTLPPRVRLPPLSSQALTSVIDLTEWNNGELQRPINSMVSAKPLTSEFPVNMVDILVRPEAAGESILSMEDRGLLGGHPVEISLKFEPVTGLALELWEDVNDQQLEMRASSRDPTIREIETDTLYKLRCIASGRSGPFSSALSKALSPNIVVTPNRDVSIGRTEDTDQLSSHTLQAKKVGKYTITSALPSKDRLAVSSPAFEVLVHQPLRVTPAELVLLPGGHNWELKIEGGGTARRSFSFQTSDSSVVETPQGSLSHDVRPILRSNGRGQAEVRLVRAHAPAVKGSPSPKENAATVHVMVAQPARTGIIANGQLYTNSILGGSLLTIPTNKISRIRGTMLTHDHRQFTLGHLLFPSGLETDSTDAPLDATSQSGYTCKYTWTSDNPKVVSFVDDAAEADDTNSSSAAEITVKYTPELKSKISGQTRLAATLYSREPGSVRLTFSADCADRQKWGAPFSKWSHTTTLPVVVSEDETGLVELPNMPLFAGVRTPIVQLGRSTLPIIPGLTQELQPSFANRQMSKSEDVFASPNELLTSYRLGESVTLLPSSQYVFTPNWHDSKWTFDVLCPDETEATNSLQTTKSCGATGAVTQCVQTPPRDDSRTSLVITTGSQVGSQALISLKGVKSTHTLSIPVVVGDATEVQIVPLASLYSGSRVPIECAEQLKRPVRVEPNTARQFQIIMRDSQKRIIPAAHDLKLSIISSHPSVVDIDDADDLSIDPGQFTLQTRREGCASVMVSVTSGENRVADVITICSQYLPSTGNQKLVAGQTETSDVQITVPAAWHTLLSPWLTHYHLSGTWAIVVCVGLISAALAVSQSRSEKADRAGAHVTSTTSSPHRKSGSGLTRDWATTVTPVAPRSLMTAFPSTRRTYAPPPTTRS